MKNSFSERLQLYKDRIQFLREDMNSMELDDPRLTEVINELESVLLATPFNSKDQCESHSGLGSDGL